MKKRIISILFAFCMLVCLLPSDSAEIQKSLQKQEPGTGIVKNDFFVTTGDNSELYLWITLLVLSGSAAAGSVIVIRKKIARSIMRRDVTAASADDG